LLGHEVELHTHWPFTHSWPAPQAAPLPHWQVPPAEQPSATKGSQRVQAAPFSPQVNNAAA
jgi:hypothetical protein